MMHSVATHPAVQITWFERVILVRGSFFENTPEHLIAQHAVLAEGQLFQKRPPQREVHNGLDVRMTQVLDRVAVSHVETSFATKQVLHKVPHDTGELRVDAPTPQLHFQQSHVILELAILTVDLHVRRGELTYAGGEDGKSNEHEDQH